MRADSTARATLDSLLRFITPKAAVEGASAFPYGLQYHAKHRENSNVNGSNRGLVCFHAAAAIDAYFEFVRLSSVKGRTLTIPAETLLARLHLIETIAELGTSSFCATGSPATGYRLELVTDVQKRLKEAQQRADTFADEKQSKR